MEYTDVYLATLQRARQPITQPYFKIGGNPVFLAETEWPRCERCGNEMQFLAQIPLQEPIVFSTTYQMAYIFMCPADDRRYQCYTWEARSGANRVILQKGVNTIVGVPTHRSVYPDYEVVLQRTQEPMVNTRDAKGNLIVERAIEEQVSEQTKLGGVPAWLQEEDTPYCQTCHKPMRLLAQINAELDGPLPANFYEYPKGTFLLLEFGDAGLGYVFICRDSCSPLSAAFLWQTT